MSHFSTSSSSPLPNPRLWWRAPRGYFPETALRLFLRWAHRCLLLQSSGGVHRRWAFVSGALLGQGVRAVGGERELGPGGRPPLPHRRWRERGRGLRRRWSHLSRAPRTVKKLESINAMISLLWWMLGFYWIVVGGQTLLQDAPRLYWLTVVFLAFDVFFAIFCIMLACIIGIALCCCLPCIIAFLYAVAGQEGASDADLSRLLKFRFRGANQPKNFDLGKEQAVTVTIMEQDSIADLALPPEDSECCICLSQYEDGAELHSLPCNHHFHSGCIVKWLRINATCPLCKYNILQGDEYV